MFAEAASVLREHELKATPQRIAIYKYLRESCEHPTAEKIYAELHDTFPSMSFSTVYKALENFKEKKLIIELNAGESFFRYDANISPHSHFLCLKCGALINAGPKEAENAPEELKDCRILCELLYFFGYCPNCAQEQKN